MEVMGLLCLGRCGLSKLELEQSVISLLER
jgi:hypothetical protein